MKRKVIHLICQAHLDPVWLWPLQDGLSEALTTMQSAVDRAKEIPSFKFTRSSAAIHRWAQRTDPYLWEEIKNLAKAGRWEPVGNWVEQADCNLPSTESLLRQSLYAGDFFRREFGFNSHIGYNVDSFGHAGGIPQILLRSGLKYYVFMRPAPHETQKKKLPLLFWWEGNDGSRVIAQRVPISYSQSYASTADDIEVFLREAAKTNFAPGFHNAPFWFGVGNHGGGPTREHLERVLLLQGDGSLPELRFSTLEQYFNAIEKESAFRKLPVYRGELQHHARGCYSATGEVKKWHRASEKAIMTAESVAALVGGCNSAHRDGLRNAWWHLLLSQFHDIIAGSCTAQTLDETGHRFGSILNTSSEITLELTQALARRVDTRDEKGSVLFVLNTLPWARKVLIQLDTFKAPHANEMMTHLEEKSGKRVPFQWLSADANFGPWGLSWGKLAAVVEIPAGGYRVFRIATDPLDIKTATSRGQFVANQVPVTVRKRSKSITRIAALASLPLLDGKDLLAGPVGLVVLRDVSDTWAHGIDAFRDEIGRPKIISTQELEGGALIRIVRQKSRWRSSEIWMDVVHYAHTAVVELRFKINWQERRQIAKIEIPTLLKEVVVFAKTPGQIVRRSANGQEESCQDWVALQGKIDSHKVTLGLINSSSYSYDAMGGTLRMILARSAPFAEHSPFKFEDERNAHFMDQGWMERSFWLHWGNGAVATLALDRRSQEWQIPSCHMFDSAHPGDQPWEESFIEIEPKNVAMLALKPMEVGSDIIVRVQEMQGIRTIARAKWRKRPFTFELRPWEIKSIKLFSGEGSTIAKETDLYEEANMGE